MLAGQWFYGYLVRNYRLFFSGPNCELEDLSPRGWASFAVAFHTVGKRAVVFLVK